MCSSYETIYIDIEEEVGIVTIDRPDHLNAINRKVYNELYEALKELERNNKVRVIIITGRGEKAFVAGADITEMKDMTSQDARRMALLGSKVGQAIEEMGIPVIAAVNGFALGGGCELAITCDFVIATNNSIFGQPEINLGIIPGNGGTQRLSRLIGLARAKELVFLGETIDASKALEIGLINKLIKHDEDLLTEAKKIAKLLAKKSKVALTLAKAAMNNGVNMDLNRALYYEIECFAECFASEDQKEGLTAFIEKRKPVFKDK